VDGAQCEFLFSLSHIGLVLFYISLHGLNKEREMLTGCDAMIQGLTTAAQKLQRKKILAKFQKEVDQAYGGK
jgi:hypothetical protein